jgi:TPR repeat protein
VPESCETALLHYEFAANEAASQIEKRGYVLPLERNRLSDDTAAAVRGAGAGGGEMDHETLDYFAQLAQDGDMSSAISLASIYSSGYKNIKVDMQLAVKYLSLAADAGWINAQGQLGLFLATGPEGVQVDPDRAFHLLSNADRRQDTLGTLGLGYCYFKGIGVGISSQLLLSPHLTSSADRCQSHESHRASPKSLRYDPRPCLLVKTST